MACVEQRRDVEYGENFGRPHYHLCLFNLDFKDKLFWKTIDGNPYYISNDLREVWPFGNNAIGQLTFESAAYTARYCTKKITCPDAQAHYGLRIPEFSKSSNRPGIGATWLDKYGRSDCFNHGHLIVNGVKCKPPRYYDKRFEALDPEGYADMKVVRLEKAMLKADDNSHDRLMVKEMCQEARIKKLIRKMEREL